MFAPYLQLFHYRQAPSRDVHRQSTEVELEKYVVHALVSLREDPEASFSWSALNRQSVHIVERDLSVWL